ncbi:hypothetical protein DTO166G4_1083 [Paecilomyces variotii]|nr:hypothetical protein DTO166G4_1083 [Paecilomyces variotii]KAJ9231819.1 hypothetical protein DTO169E5_7804 [Paecilomyces variotii]KAJ9241916.1 hypothetical protein DTO166G5_992 [Paecilomyces variotii]KAJ9266094.1 hypothetical protein DTO195F2_1209 [Paecilomyces variotii]KAJ9287145.1 hypothetical protein DTO021C3_5281 [Paecilomyces variotii]
MEPVTANVDDDKGHDSAHRRGPGGLANDASSVAKHQQATNCTSSTQGTGRLVAVLQSPRCFVSNNNVKLCNSARFVLRPSRVGVRSATVIIGPFIIIYRTGAGNENFVLDEPIPLDD